MEINQINIADDDELVFERHYLVEMYQNIIESAVYHTPVAIMTRLGEGIYHMRWDPKDITLLELVSRLQYYANPYNFEQLSVGVASEMEYLIQLMDKHKKQITVHIHNFGDANKVQ